MPKANLQQLEHRSMITIVNTTETTKGFMVGREDGNQDPPPSKHIIWSKSKQTKNTQKKHIHSNYYVSTLQEVVHVSSKVAQRSAHTTWAYCNVLLSSTYMYLNVSSI